MFVRCLGWLLLFAATMAVAETREEAAERRWEFVSTSDVQYLLDFLREYPDSPRVAEARERLEASDAKPLGRLVAPTAECRALVDERARSLVDDDLGVSPPPGFFEASPRWVAAEGGVDPDAVPIERRFTLSLIAGRSGDCSLIIRWRYGSGLGEACRCEPLEPGFVFESPMAKAILADLAHLHAANSVCVTEGQPDQSALISQVLDALIASKRGTLDAIRAKQASGAFVLPTEAGEADEIAHALPQLERRVVDTSSRVTEEARLRALQPSQRQGFCQSVFPDRLERASMRFGLERLRQAVLDAEVR